MKETVWWIQREDSERRFVVAVQEPTKLAPVGVLVHRIPGWSSVSTPYHPAVWPLFRRTTPHPRCLHIPNLNA